MLEILGGDDRSRGAVQTQWLAINWQYRLGTLHAVANRPNTKEQIFVRNVANLGTSSAEGSL